MCEYASSKLVCEVKVTVGTGAPTTGHDLRREV